MHPSATQGNNAKLISENAMDIVQDSSAVLHPSNSFSPLLSAFLMRQDVSTILESHPAYHLGTWHYHTSTSTLLPPLNLALNCTISVLIPTSFISWNNPKVIQCALWGCSIYTDDSDIVCMLIHTGRVQLPDPLSKQPESFRTNETICPTFTHLAVTLRVLPRLEAYQSVLSHGLRSRYWNLHDGVSLIIESAKKNYSSSFKIATSKSRKQQLRDRLALQRWVRSGFSCGHPLDAHVLSFCEGIACLLYTQRLETVLQGKSFCSLSHSYLKAQTPLVYIFVSKSVSNLVYELRTVELPTHLMPNMIKLTHTKLVLDEINWSTDFIFQEDGIKVQGLGSPNNMPDSPNNLQEKLTRKTILVDTARIWLILGLKTDVA